jgi:uncharacterized protein YraI
MNRIARMIRWTALAALAPPVVALAQQAYTNRLVNVRAGPDVQYPVVSTLPAGTSVYIEGCLDGWTWCDVQFGPDRGWIYAPYLDYVYGNSYIPFYTYAPTLGIPLITFSVGPYWDRYYYGRPWYGRRDYWVSRPPPTYYRPPPPRPPPQYRPPPPPRPPQIQPVPGGGAMPPPQGRPPPPPPSQGMRPQPQPGQSPPPSQGGMRPPSQAQPAQAAPPQSARPVPGGGAVEPAR